MSWNAPKHSYEELRPIVIEGILNGCNEFRALEEYVGHAVMRQHGTRYSGPTGMAYQGSMASLHPSDASTVLEIFWDLFRQGVITLGKDSSNPNWPWFRLSRSGKTISQNPIRFHDTATYIQLIKTFDNNISAEAERYLEEAAASFYAECLLAATVMLGAAAECEFLKLLDIATKGKHKAAFATIAKENFIKGKIRKFQVGLATIAKSLPKECTEDLETQLNTIQAVIRVARNDAGHPSGAAAPTRDQVYTYLNLFGPFAKQLAALKKELA